MRLQDRTLRHQQLERIVGKTPAYLSPHDLRHTAASLAVQSGANVTAVQCVLGHECAALTLDIDSDLSDTDLGEVAARADATWEALG